MVTKGGTASASKEETKSSAESNDLERDGRSLPCRQRPKLGAPAASNALVLGLERFYPSVGELADSRPSYRSKGLR